MLTGMEWVTKISRIPFGSAPPSTRADHARRIEAAGQPAGQHRPAHLAGAGEDDGACGVLQFGNGRHRATTRHGRA